MLAFITENLGTLIVGAIVLAITALIVVRLIRRGKKSFCSCGDCSSCAGCTGCDIKSGDNKIVIKKANNAK